MESQFSVPLADCGVTVQCSPCRLWSHSSVFPLQTVESQFSVPLADCGVTVQCSPCRLWSHSSVFPLQTVESQFSVPLADCGVTVQCSPFRLWGHSSVFPLQTVGSQFSTCLLADCGFIDYRRFPEITGKDNLTLFSYSGRVKSPEWRPAAERRADLRHFEIFRHGPIMIYTRLPAGGTYYPICMFPTNSERLIGISDAFSVFVYGYPSSCPRAHCTPNKSAAYSALHPQAWTFHTGHACRHLPSAVPWINSPLHYSIRVPLPTVESLVKSVSPCRRWGPSINIQHVSRCRLRSH